MTDLLLPPSCNWFQHNGVSSRSEDKIIVLGCFRCVVVLRLPNEASSPETVKIIQHQPGRVTGVAIYPDSSHPEFGNTIGIIGDQSTLTLSNFSTGAHLAQHRVQKIRFQSLCWGCVGGEEVIAAVGDAGSLFIWEPQYMAVRSFVISKKDLSVIEVFPQDKSKAVIASEKSILVTSLKQGEVLFELKGHDHPIYCLRWYPGKGNPLTGNDLQINSRWKLDEEETKIDKSFCGDDKIGGPYFASSDLGRHILLWDLTLKRYIIKIVAPVAVSISKKMSKEKGSKYHISLNWHDNNLYSSTVMGEVILWSLSPVECKHKMVHHLHVRAIYNMEFVNNVLLTFSQDRSIQAYDVHNKKSFCQIQTLGSCAGSMVFCPYDAHRLALGLHEGAIRILTFCGNQPEKVVNICQNIKDKVIALSWHPYQEGLLLFGTLTGQVGIADVCSGKVSTFAHYHQKAVYKVDWGPPPNLAEPRMDDPWYAYSFGDKEMLMRNPMRLLDDPVNINSVLKLEANSDSKDTVTEFAFSSDFEYVALGSLSGVIKIFEWKSTRLMITICRIRKTVQHLLWKPSSNTLAVGSAEVNVYVFQLDQALDESKSSGAPVTITQPFKELVAHTSRIVWLSWSPHQDGILASASYDHTVQIWNTNTGEPVCNYHGHRHRVFRVEFSPVDPDLMISFAEENSVHQWRPSKITDRTPKESSVSIKHPKPKYASEEQADNENIGEQGSKSTTKGEAITDVPSQDSSAGSAVAKKSAAKSFFPLFHSVATRKKAFLHMCVLSMMEGIIANKRSLTVDGQNGTTADDELFEDNHSLTYEKDSEQMDHKQELTELYVENALKKYGAFMPVNQPLPEVEDICHYINFFGNLSDLDEVVKKEIANHKVKDNSTNANIMHCWQGSLESHIRFAAKHKQLDALLVSLAPQVSFSLWELACEAYAEQLVVDEQPAMAATYLLAIHKDEEAIDLLLRHKLYREALIVARFRIGFNQDIINKVVATWTSAAVFEGSFEMAAALQLSTGNIENGARLMARRTESGALIVAAKLYEAAEQHNLAYSTALLGLKEASMKHEFKRIETTIEHMPKLTWYKYITVCHQCLLKHIEKYYPEDSALSPFPENISYVTPVGLSPVENIIKIWKQFGHTSADYEEYRTEVQKEFSTLNMPTSHKQLWFLIGKSVTTLLLDGLCNRSGSFQPSVYLDELLKYVIFWNKNDQIYYLTHALLFSGVHDLSTLYISNIESCMSLSQIREEYVTSEAKELLAYLEKDESYKPWIAESDSSVEFGEREKLEVNVISGEENHPDIITTDTVTQVTGNCASSEDVSTCVAAVNVESDIPCSAESPAAMPVEEPCSIIQNNIRTSDDSGEDNLNAVSRLKEDNLPEEINEGREESHCPKLQPFYKNISDFLRAFDTFITIWNSQEYSQDENNEGAGELITCKRSCHQNSLNAEEKKTLLSQIVIRLCERAAINESVFRELFSKIENVK